MRRSRVSSEEQYRLIMEWRQSGLSDYQWCLEHDINPGTFYNWVKRLRQKQCQDIPEAADCISDLSARTSPKRRHVR